MKDLIEALTIFQKYKDVDYPTHCEHDALYIMEVGRDEVSAADAKRLEKLGFIWSEEDDGAWISFKFGSA